MSASLHHRQRVSREILRRDEPGRIGAPAQTADSETTALAERVAFETKMPADDHAVLGFDRAGAAREP